MRRLAILLLLQLAIAAPAEAAIAFVSRVAGGDASGSTSVAAPAQTHTAGNLLVVIVWGDWSGAATDSSCSDTDGNTFTPVPASLLQAGVGVVELQYAYNIGGQASNVVTCTFADSVSYRAISVLEFSGFGASDPFASSDGVSSTGTAMATGTLTRSGEALIVAGMKHNSADMSGGGGYTFNEFGITGEAGLYWADQYKILSADEAPTASAGSSANWWMLAAAFNGTGGGGGGAVRRNLMLLGVGR